MILVDTSVWVEHLRSGTAGLATLLENDVVLCHPLIVGEIACGSLRDREDVLQLLRQLPQAQVAGHDDALAFLDAHRLMGTGLGWIDVHLLTSTVLSRTSLWTRDRRLRDAAVRLHIAAR